MIVSIITSVIIFLYLLFQSIKDAKSMSVYSIPNNIALFFSIGLYVWDCFHLGINLSWECIIIMIAIVFGKIIGSYGTGDMKAMIVIYFMLRYWYPSYPHPSTAVFLLVILISNLLFLLYYGINKVKAFRKKESFQKKKAAYFPVLTIGYVIGVILGIMISL